MYYCNLSCHCANERGEEVLPARRSVHEGGFVCPVSPAQCPLVITLSITLSKG